jgi:hypothetical protein
VDRVPVRPGRQRPRHCDREAVLRLSGSNTSAHKSLASPRV